MDLKLERYQHVMKQVLVAVKERILSLCNGSYMNIMIKLERNGVDDSSPASTEMGLMLKQTCHAKLFFLPVVNISSLLLTTLYFLSSKTL